MSWNDELALQLGKPELSAPLEAVLNSNLQNNQVKAFVKRAIDQKLQTMFGYASFVSNPDLKVFKAALHRREFYNDQSLVYYLPYDRDFHSLANILQSRKAEISPFHNIIVTPISLSKNSETIDIDQLEYQIKIDIFKDRVPVFVLGRYGSPITGEIDDLKSLQMICSRNLMWLHVKGCCLSLNSVKCDSFEVDIGLVYNLKTPKIVFFKTIDWSLLSPKTSLLVDPVSVVEVDAKDNWSAQSTETDRLEITLPLYKFLFDHGDQSAMRVYHCAQLIETLYGFIKGNRFLSTVPSVTLLTFLVRYNGVFKSEDVKVGNDLFDKVCLELKRKQASEMNETNRVYNIATKHMYEAIDFETREKLDMRLIKVDGLVYIKYTPFNSTAEIEEQAVFATELVNNLIEFSNCIASCSLMKSLFRQIASKFTSLVLLNVTDVKPSKFDQILNEYAFKIGAVRFEPTLKGLDDNSIEEINKKIIEIVKLSSPLFFTGKTNSGSVCVGLGIPTEAYTASIIKDILMYIEAVGVIVEHDFIEELQKVVQEEIKRVERRQSNWSLSSLGNLFGFEEEKMHRFDSKAHF